MAVELAPELLAVLACPNCHGGLAVDHERSELVCTSPDCQLAYPVRDQIPVLLIDEARPPKGAEPAGAQKSPPGKEPQASANGADRDSSAESQPAEETQPATETQPVKGTQPAKETGLPVEEAARPATGDRPTSQESEPVEGPDSARPGSTTDGRA